MHPASTIYFIYLKKSIFAQTFKKYFTKLKILQNFISICIKSILNKVVTVKFKTQNRRLQSPDILISCYIPLEECNSALYQGLYSLGRNAILHSTKVYIDQVGMQFCTLPRFIQFRQECNSALYQGLYSLGRNTVLHSTKVYIQFRWECNSLLYQGLYIQFRQKCNSALYQGLYNLGRNTVLISTKVYI